MPARRLDDRIYDLCAKAISTPEGPELENTIKELQVAIREVTNRIRHRLIPPGPERRVAPQPEFTKEPHASLLWDLSRDADHPEQTE